TALRVLERLGPDAEAVVARRLERVRQAAEDAHAVVRQLAARFPPPFRKLLLFEPRDFLLRLLEEPLQLVGLLRIRDLVLLFLQRPSNVSATKDLRGRIATIPGPPPAEVPVSGGPRCRPSRPTSPVAFAGRPCFHPPGRLAPARSHSADRNARRPSRRHVRGLPPRPGPAT